MDNFQKIKTLFTTAPILSLPLEDKDYIIYCDASHSGFGDILMQDKKGIAYTPCQLKVHERNYLAHYLELVALVFVFMI